MNLTSNQFAANTTTNLALAGMTAILSMLGTTFIVLTYLLWKDIQSPSRRILVYISFADFFLALGNLVGVFTRSRTICLVQSIVVTFSSLSSNVWTVLMAVYLYYNCSQRKLIQRGFLFCIFHVIGWGLPFVVTCIASYEAKLGYSADIVTSGWCWVSVRLSWKQQVAWMLATGMFWEILSYVIISVLYLLVNRSFSKKSRGWRLRDGRREKLIKITEVKLIIVPLVFISLHIWGTIRFFIFVQTGPTVNRPDTSWLLYFQGIGDNAQGFANFIIFCFCTEKVQRKIKFFCSQCCGRERPSETTVTIVTEQAAPNYGSTDKKKGKYDPTYADLG